jgi:hypothetical protein
METALQPRGRTIMDESTRKPESAYDPPAIRVLGSVAELTQDLFDKRLGGSDGWTFMGINAPIHNVSP